VPGFNLIQPPACALLPSSSFQILQTRLRARHPTVIIMTRHQRSLNHIFLPSCLHHLLVASSISLFENCYSLACFWSVYDYSIAVATTIVPCLHAVVVAASYSKEDLHDSTSHIRLRIGLCISISQSVYVSRFNRSLICGYFVFCRVPPVISNGSTATADDDNDYRRNRNNSNNNIC
jgi:hypothetical protein